MSMSIADRIRADFKIRDAHVSPVVDEKYIEILSQLPQLASYHQQILPTFADQILQRHIRARSSRIIEIVQDYYQYQNINSLRQWCEELILQELNHKWCDLYLNYSTTHANDLANQDKAIHHVAGCNFVYGEVMFMSFASVLFRSIPLKAGMKLYDLGSGTGRCIFAAALLHNFSQCIGIEYLPKLVEASHNVQTQWEQEFAQHYPSKITTIQGNIWDFDWTDADVVVSNSTCFDDALMKHISVVSEKMRDNTYVISLTTPLTSPWFTVAEWRILEMSWGFATVYVHRKMSQEEVQQQQQQQQQQQNKQKR